MKNICITGATVVTQDRARKVWKADVLIENGLIAEIRASQRQPKVPRGFRTVTADGMHLLPGFVQTHIHLCQTLFRNAADDMELLDWLSKKIWVYEARHTAQTLKVSALAGLHELLSSGTTCILDMGTVRHTETLFEAVKLSGIRANVGKCLMDHPENNPRDLRESTAAALNEAIALHKKWNGHANDRIRASFAPRFAISCTEELLKKVAAIARERGAIIHTHASENKKECEMVQKMSGRSNIEYLDALGLCGERSVIAHGVWLSDAEIKLLAQRGTSITHCPSSNLKLASGIARVPELRKSGVRVALGADGAPCNNTLDIFHEMRLAATLHKPRLGPKTLPATEVLDLATREGAEALHWFDQIGSIEVGKKADLVALDLNTSITLPSDPLDLEAVASSIVYSASPTNVAWTMVDGQMVYQNGKVTTIDSAKLLRDYYRARKEIF